MLKNKYTLILLIIIGVFFLYRLIPEIILYLSPPNALFWTASIIEVGLAFLTINIITNDKYARFKIPGLILFFIAAGIPFIIAISDANILKPIGPTYMMCGVVWMVFAIRQAITSRNSQNRMTENTEALSKGGVLSILIFAGIFVFAAILFGLIIGLMTCTK